MKGVNTLKVNPETMCEAVQLWIDGQFSGTSKPKVTKVEHEKVGSGYSETYQFSVTLSMEETQK